jgi:hypothetical protein
MTSQLIIREERVQEDLGSSLVNSFSSREVLELAVTLPDAALSYLTSDTVLSNVPIFGALYNLTKGCFSIGDHFFLKKIAYFLAGCEQKDLSERTKLEQGLAIDHKLQAKVGDDLLLILESLDNYKKATILAKIFRARLRDDIDENTFFKLATAIKNASIADLATLERSYEKIATYDIKAGKPFTDTLDNATAQSLFNVGLVKADGYTETLYRHNELGTKLLTLLRAE